MGRKEKLLPVNVVAERLQITDRHVRRLVQQGKLEGEKLSERRIRIAEAALKAYQEHFNEEG